MYYEFTNYVLQVRQILLQTHGPSLLNWKRLKTVGLRWMLDRPIKVKVVQVTGRSSPILVDSLSSGPPRQPVPVQRYKYLVSLLRRCAGADRYYIVSYRILSYRVVHHHRRETPDAVRLGFHAMMNVWGFTTMMMMSTRSQLHNRVLFLITFTSHTRSTLSVWCRSSRKARYSNDTTPA